MKINKTKNNIVKYRTKKKGKVLQLLQSIHPMPPSKWRGLKEKEKAFLQKITKNKKHQFRRKAITALVLSNASNHVRTLGNIIQNNNENEQDRIVAIISLGRSKDPNAEKILMQFLNIKNDYTKSKVIESLGKVGSKECLPKLIDVSKKKKTLSSENAKYASKLLAYRLQIGE